MTFDEFWEALTHDLRKAGLDAEQAKKVARSAYRVGYRAGWAERLEEIKEDTPRIDRRESVAR